MKIQQKFYYLIIILTMVSCASGVKETKETIYTAPFFGIQPSDEPQLLAPELLAAPTDEYNGTFSPDGREFYYTTDIPGNAYITFTKLRDDNTWSSPKIASFSGTYSDFDPLFSPDGKRIYFSSSRPLPDNKNSKNWYVEKENEKWEEPQRILLTGEENNEYYCSVTNEGTIYFNIWSQSKIFRAVKEDTSYSIIDFSNEIKSDFDMGDPYISPSEDYIIFRGYRDDSFGRGDLYISFNIDNQWTKPENLGKPINSENHEMCPWVSQDGKIFIFASNRIINHLETKPLDHISKVHQNYKKSDNGNLNIYYMSTKFIDRMKSKYLK